MKKHLFAILLIILALTSCKKEKPTQTEHSKIGIEGLEFLDSTWFSWE